MSKPRLIVTILAGTAVLLGAGALFASRNPFHEANRKSAAEATELLKEMGKAEVTFFKIDPDSELQKPEERNGKTLRNWTILSEKILSEEKISEVRAILTDPQSYNDIKYKCFEPGLGFRFKSGDRMVEFVICLQCSWVYAYSDKDILCWNLNKDGNERLLKFYKRETETMPAPKVETGT